MEKIRNIKKQEQELISSEDEAELFDYGGENREKIILPNRFESEFIIEFRRWFQNESCWSAKNVPEVINTAKKMVLKLSPMTLLQEEKTLYSLPENIYEKLRQRISIKINQENISSYSIPPFETWEKFCEIFNENAKQNFPVLSIAIFNLFDEEMYKDLFQKLNLNTKHVYRNFQIITSPNEKQITVVCRMAILPKDIEKDDFQVVFAKREITFNKEELRQAISHRKTVDLNFTTSEWVSNPLPIPFDETESMLEFI